VRKPRRVLWPTAGEWTRYLFSRPCLALFTLASTVAVSIKPLCLFRSRGVVQVALLVAFVLAVISFILAVRDYRGGRFRRIGFLSMLGSGLIICLVGSLIAVMLAAPGPRG
jgi:hypothetical protein